MQLNITMSSLNSTLNSCVTVQRCKDVCIEQCNTNLVHSSMNSYMMLVFFALISLMMALLLYCNIESFNSVCLKHGIIGWNTEKSYIMIKYMLILSAFLLVLFLFFFLR